MTKIIYLLLTVIILVPGLMSAALVICTHHQMRTQVRALYQSPAPSASIRVWASPLALQAGPLKFSIALRLWAAVLVWAGATLWLVGITFLVLPATR